MRNLVLPHALLLSACGQNSATAARSPTDTESQLKRQEVEALCKDVGNAAYYDPKVPVGPGADAARAGAIAECKLKYLTKR